MANILLLNDPFTNVGLGTWTHTIAATGQYNVSLQCTEVPPSGLSIVVKKNTVTFFTAPVITPTQIALQFKVGFQAAATDVIDVVLASSAAIDNELNTVKSTISLSQGIF